MSNRLRVYVAGPISTGDLQHNIDQARKAGLELIAEGFAPLVPQLTCFMGGDTPSIVVSGTSNCGVDHSVWLDVDLPWVGIADLVLRLPGESKGADMEVAHAIKMGVPVVYSVQEAAQLGRRYQQEKDLQREAV